MVLNIAVNLEIWPGEKNPPAPKAQQASGESTVWRFEFIETITSTLSPLVTKNYFR